MSSKIHKKISLLFLTVVYVINFIDRQLIAVVSPAIKEEFNMSLDEIGFLYGTSFAILYAIFGIPFGRLADLFSRKVILLSCLTIWSLSMFLGGWAKGFLDLVLLRFALALFESGASPTSYSIISSLYPSRNISSSISIYASGIFLGIATSFLIGGKLLNWIGWRDTFQWAGLLGITIAGIGTFVLPSDRNRERVSKIELQSSMKTIFRYLKEPIIRYHLIGFSLLAFSGYSLLSFISLVLSNSGRADLISPFGWFFIGVGLMVALHGFLADKFALKNEGNRFLTVMITTLLGLPFYIFGLLQDDPLWLFTLIGLGVMITSSYNGVAASIIQSIVNENDRGLAGGIYLFAISVGGFGLGPYITGSIAEWLPSSPNSLNFALIIVLSICSIGAIYFLNKARISSRVI